MAAIDHAEVRSLLAEIYDGYEIVDHLATLDPVTLKELIDDTILNLDISKRQ